MPKPHEQIKPWKVIDTRLLVDRAPWLVVREQDVTLPNGTTIDGYLLAQSRDFAMVFALTKKKEVLLVEQYKHGMGEAMIELPAGYLDSADPSPLECARRELKEETGYTSTDWRFLGSLVLDPNRSDNRAHYFLALDAYPLEEQHLDPTEDILVHTIAFNEVGRLARTGKICSLASVAGILLAMDELKNNMEKTPGPPP